METTIKIQKEFEVLVSELEKLKKINEITSSNANNANKTINEIESFVIAVNSFKKRVEDDYKNKKKDLEAVLNSLSIAFEAINQNTEKHSERFSELLKELSDKSFEETFKIQNTLIKKVDKYSEELSEVNKENRVSIELFTSTTIKQINKRERLLEDRINAISEKLESVLTKQNEINERTQNEININKTENRKRTLFEIAFAIILIGLLLGLLIK